MSPRFVLGRENVPCVAEVVNRSLKADCTDFTLKHLIFKAVTVNEIPAKHEWVGSKGTQFSKKSSSNYLKVS